MVEEDGDDKTVNAGARGVSLREDVCVHHGREEWRFRGELGGGRGREEWRFAEDFVVAVSRDSLPPR